MATQGTRQIKNLRIRWERVERRERFERRVSRSTILLCLLVASLSLPAFGQTELTLWHTLGVGGTEEQKLTEAVEDFERAHLIQRSRLPAFPTRKTSRNLLTQLRRARVPMWSVYRILSWAKWAMSVSTAPHFGGSGRALYARPETSLCAVRTGAYACEKPITGLAC